MSSPAGVRFADICSTSLPSPDVIWGLIRQSVDAVAAQRRGGVVPVSGKRSTAFAANYLRRKIAGEAAMTLITQR